MASGGECEKKRTFFKYRTHAYDLASKIGRDNDIYDQFNKGFQKHDKGTYDLLKGRVYVANKNQIVTLLDLFNMLESLGKIEVTTGQCDYIVKILKCTGDNECIRLAVEFEKNLREVEQEEITDSGAQKAFCFFLRNENINNGNKLVDHLTWLEYKRIFKELGIGIIEINQYLLKDFQNEMKSINKRIISKSHYDLIFVILIGYNDSNPIEAGFMMNEEVGKEIKRFDIHHDLIRPMKTEFHDKKMIFVNITQSLPGGRDQPSTEDFSDKQRENFIDSLPKNIAYLHIHANKSSSIEKLFEKMIMKTWLYSENLVHKLAEVGKKHDFRIVTEYKPQPLGLNNATTETDAILNVYQPQKVIVIKIKINGTETEGSKDFCEYSLGYEKNVYAITLKTEDEGMLEKNSSDELIKKIKEKTAAEKKYDLFVFVMCSAVSMPAEFYQNAGNLWSSALGTYALTKPKILIIDVEIQEGKTFELPEISTVETLLICTYQHTHEQMFLDRLVQELKDDAHRNYDLIQHVKETFSVVAQGTQWKENFPKGIHLKEEKRVGK